MPDSFGQPHKRALLVGINKYPNLPDNSQLKGCVNDVLMIRMMLEESFQFPPENVNVLTDEQATEQGIRDAMEKLVADCVGGDIVVFHYSGHGSQMAAKGEKPRGYDESIMPHDSGRMNASFPRQVQPRDIRDTDIHEWLQRLSQKTPHITLLFDSCHSGSITRMESDSQTGGTILRWVEPDPLPAATVAPAIPAAAAGRGVAREVGRSGWLPLSDKYVLLAACAAEQGAYELEHSAGGAPQRNGAFTFFLTQEITQGGTNATYMDIWERVASKVTGRFIGQTPQIEGTRDKLIFGVQDFSPMRYLLVEGRQGEEVHLKGGAVHGLTVGSRLEIYPPGTKRVAEAKEGRQGLAEVVSVTATNARAKIIEETRADEINANSRAVEVVHAYNETRMPVWLAPAPVGYERAVEELQELLAQSKLLEMKGSVTGARAQIRVSAGEEFAGGRGVASPANGDAAASWVVLDLSETPLMSRRPVSTPESKFAITENLEAIWRYQKIQELSNERSALKGKVDFDLLKKGADGVWYEVAKIVDAVYPVYEVGEPIAFRVVNRSGIPLYASVLDLGVSKRIDVLYPPAGAGEEIAVKRSGEADAAARLGGVLSVGNQAGNEIELFLPENHTFIATPADAAPLRGKEIFKLVVTARRHDLSFLRQSGLRKDPPHVPTHPLEALLYLAATSEMTREARVKLDLPDEWFTVERAFWLQQSR